VRGLWAWSRHPNLAAEQAIWVAFNQWAGVASGTPLNWSIVGAIGYLLIFAGSTPLTEEISAGKYPEYREYKKLVGRFVPGLLGGVFRSYQKEEGEAKKSPTPKRKRAEKKTQ